MRSMCAKGVSLDVGGGVEGTRWDGLGWHGRRRERMIKRRVRRKADAGGGGELDS